MPLISSIESTALSVGMSLISINFYLFKYATKVGIFGRKRVRNYDLLLAYYYYRYTRCAVDDDDEKAM